MLNPNIELLENLISAAVSTRYKEVPPTEEEFLTLAQSMRATLSTLPVTDEEFAEILVRLRASIVIQMDVGVYINDRNTPHIFTCWIRRMYLTAHWRLLKISRRFSSIFGRNSITLS